jgi:hypothetical protein
MVFLPFFDITIMDVLAGMYWGMLGSRVALGSGTCDFRIGVRDRSAHSVARHRAAVIFAGENRFNAVCHLAISRENAQKLLAQPLRLSSKRLFSISASVGGSPK